MKKYILLIVAAMLLVSCSNKVATEDKEPSAEEQVDNEENPVITFITERADEKYHAKTKDIEVISDAGTGEGYILHITLSRLGNKDKPDKLYDDLEMYSDDMAAVIAKEEMFEAVNQAVIYWELENGEPDEVVLKRVSARCGKDDEGMCHESEYKNPSIFK